MFKNWTNIFPSKLVKFISFEESKKQGDYHDEKKKKDFLIKLPGFFFVKFDRFSQDLLSRWYWSLSLKKV